MNEIDRTGRSDAVHFEYKGQRGYLPLPQGQSVLTTTGLVIEDEKSCIFRASPSQEHKLGLQRSRTI